MNKIFVLIFILNSYAVSAKCIDDTASPEQNFISCKSLAEQGDAYAQYALASFYNSGQGIELDAQQAVIWYKKSAQQNNDLAQYSLGVMHEFGDGGLEQSQDEADKLYRLAADNGNYFALNKLGLIVPKEIEYEKVVMPEKSSADSKIEPPKGEPNIVERFLDWVFRVEKIEKQN